MNHITPKILQSKQINNRFIKEIINNHTKRKKQKQKHTDTNTNFFSNLYVKYQSGVAYELFLANFKCNSLSFYFLTKIQVLNYRIKNKQEQQQHQNRSIRIRRNTKNVEENPRISSTRTSSSSLTHTTTQSILTNLAKQLIPRLCLIVFFILYLLTTSAVHCVHCQQVPTTTATLTGKVNTSSKADDQFMKFDFQPKLNNRTEYTAVKNSSSRSSVYFESNLFLYHNNNNMLVPSGGSFFKNHHRAINNKSDDYRNLNKDISFETSNNKYEYNKKEPRQPPPLLHHHHYELQRSANLTTIQDSNVKHKKLNKNIDEEKLLLLIMSGLKLKNLPDMNMVNISQQEYANKYKEYLRRLHARTKLHQSKTFPWNENLMNNDINNNKLALWSIVTTDSKIEESNRPKRELPFEFMSNDSRSKISRRHSNHNLDVKTKIRLNFPLNSEISMLEDEGIEEANVRLMILYSPELALRNHNVKSNLRCPHNRTLNLNTNLHQMKAKKHIVNLKVYQFTKNGKRQWIDGKKLEFNVHTDKLDETQSKWLQFDVTKAVRAWLRSNTNFSLEVQCDNCRRIGARILIDDSEKNTYKSSNSTEHKFDELRPVLNIVGRFGSLRQELGFNNNLINTTTTTINGSTRHHNTMGAYNKNSRTHKNKCKSKNQRCCRHSMEVVFKDLKGFEFIIQPKVFDAGYCQGRCPPRYNPANHHAMLQSLIWKQDHKMAPRLCCAPSKLVELEVLHVDEKDSQKLKISTWSNMQVIECACT